MTRTLTHTTTKVRIGRVDGVGVVSAFKTWLKRKLGSRRWKILNSRRWQLWRALTLDHSAVHWPWMNSATEPNMAQVHNLALRVDWQFASSKEARLALWVVSLLWPVVSLIHIRRELRANSDFVTKTHGVSVWRQSWQMLRFASRYNCPPTSYYMFRLFEPERAAWILDYVHHYEICNVLPRLNSSKPTRLLDDKRLFHDEAGRLGLSVPPITAAFVDGQVEGSLAGKAVRLPERDLVFKAFDLNCGIGFERWLYLGNQTWSNGSETLVEQQLIERCLQRSHEHGCLIQERLFNHPVLEDLAGSSLSTVRIVTCRRRNGPVSVLLASLRLPTGSAIVDNFEAGGIAAPIDLRTGTLGNAVAKHLNRGVFRLHPDTGHQITGTVLPMWPEAQALAIRAHEQFNWVAFVGWDVAITPQCPLLLEANPTWGVELMQRSHDFPLGWTPFARIFADHLHAVTERNTRFEHSGSEITTITNV